MKDAIGSVFNLTLLFAFILIVSGFVLFGVNYYKAFQVKNSIITLVEKYEGNINNSKFKEKVDNLVNGIGYSVSSISYNDDYTCRQDEGWCYKRNTENGKIVYDIVTFVSTDIPMINKIMMGLKFFHVKGSTKPITIRG